MAVKVRKWIGLVERCLTSHLEDWELAKRQNTSFEMNGHRIDDAKIEQAYRGNLHLLAKIDGRQMKRVIRSKTSEYSEIVKTGITNITEDELKNMIGKYFLGPDFDNEAPYAKLGSISGLMASCWGVV